MIDKINKINDGDVQIKIKENEENQITFQVNTIGKVRGYDKSGNKTVV